MDKPYALIRVTNLNLTLKKIILDIKCDFADNIYFVGSEDEWFNFVNKYGFVDHIDEIDDLFGLIEKADIVVLDSVTADEVENKMSKKIMIIS